MSDAARAMDEFLAHAVALETEAVERYEELADNMMVHNNEDVGELFAKLADLSRQHATSILALAADRELPALKPWEFAWEGDEAPETGRAEDSHYLMNRTQALRLALDNERRGRDFYAGVAQKWPDPAVRVLAAEFAAEEGEHVAALERWLETAPEVPENWADDLDPPHLPE